ncbi:MAG: YeeE/YedE family protein [Candidatus Aminicenantes bacterium]|nr:YeeE/YedE family protein [Candidatus Aminicenantes bacterium]NIM82469.1 YeeE/YedE family protein [Candidatus Aminicenantes bacterium]NIN21830.1 YeeE/YedE family protein [Candidatus Aminicenantes bacterium]NIN45622.1 YeeE/YedE family protein [Candidatus Aminicenantes bacterium]NIN88453.1 YeeE/YedE family protein [Candidatus Aminicenantes bacterium]
MLEWFQIDRWSPYVVGIGIGILSWLSFLFSNQTVSCSTGLSQSSGMMEKLFRGKKVEEKLYYKKHPPKADWKWMFLAGVLIGAFLAAWTSDSIDIRWIPQLWQETFGGSPLPRLIVAFVGGIFMGFGSRWANGCTSGHGISGTLQLAVSSWISVIFFFIGGIACAMLIYHVFGA